MGLGMKMDDFTLAVLIAAILFVAVYKNLAGRAATWLLRMWRRR